MTTLIQEANELEVFHAMDRKRGESIVDFVLRLDKHAHFLATERNYNVDDKIKIAKIALQPNVHARDQEANVKLIECLLALNIQS